MLRQRQICWASRGLGLGGFSSSGVAACREELGNVLLDDALLRAQDGRVLLAARAREDELAPEAKASYERRATEGKKRDGFLRKVLEMGSTVPTDQVSAARGLGESGY